MTTKPDMPELKSCPFCRCKAIWILRETEGGFKNLWFAKCAECNARSCYADDRSLAAVAWNTRPTPPAPVTDEVNTVRSETPGVLLAAIDENINYIEEELPDCDTDYCISVYVPNGLRLSHLKLIRAALSATGQLAGIPEGYALVPLEPTTEMKLQGARSIGQTMSYPNHNERSLHCYRAMIAAAQEEK